MGAITAYAISVAIILLIEYVVYKSLLANATFYRFNRFVLLTCYVVALIAIPASNFLTDIFGGTNSAAGISIGTPTAQAISADEQEGFTLWHAIPIIYLLGVIFTAIFTALSYAKMAIIIRGGSKREIDGATIVIPKVKVSPFSWGKYLVVSPDDASNELIIKHELLHIQQRHSVDLIFAQLFIIFNWFNPAALLMRRELSAVHEYDVDMHILHSGIDATSYQTLLIKKTVGAGFQSIANSLNHSQLKNRLTMMLKSKSKAARQLCAAALLPAVVLAVAMTDFPAVASSIGKIASVSYHKSSESSSTAQVDADFVAESQSPQVKDDDALDVVDQLPTFPGGVKALMQFFSENLCYPAEAAKNNIEGTVILKLIVKKTGEIGEVTVVRSIDKLLDAEAIRVCKMLPKFSPGRKDGKPVAVWYNLPVSFKLQSPKRPVQAKEVPTNAENETFIAVDEMPTFPGGIKALMEYISTNLNYPAEAAKNNIEGTVVLKFVVQKTGEIGEVSVVRSVDKLLDAEAIRVCKTLPNFNPGIKDGKPVAVFFHLPIAFKLSKSENTGK